MLHHYERRNTSANCVFVVSPFVAPNVCVPISNATSILLDEGPVGGDTSGFVPQDGEAVIQDIDHDCTSSGQSSTNPKAESQDRSEGRSTRTRSLTDGVETGTPGTITGNTNGVLPSIESDLPLAERNDITVLRTAAATEKCSTVHERAARLSHHHELQHVGAGGNNSKIAVRVSLHDY